MNICQREGREDKWKEIRERREGIKLASSGSPLTVGATFCGRDPCI